MRHSVHHHDRSRFHRSQTRRLGTAGCAAVALLLLPVSPAAAEDVTGTRIVEFCMSDAGPDLALCHGFFRGLSDTHSIYAAMGKGLHLYCLPRGVTQEQFERVAFRWMEKHPEDLERPAAVLIIQSLHEAYPCNDDGEAVSQNEGEKREGRTAPDAQADDSETSSGDG